MDDLLSAVTRATGIVAAVLAVGSLMWGFFFSARATGGRLRPAWWLDLHNWLGGAALAFTGVHIVASVLDSGSGIGWLQAIVPGTASDGWDIGWGVVATYLLAVAVFTTWPKRMSNRRWWRAIHLGSVAGLALVLVHAYLSGSDSGTGPFQVGFVIAAGLATYALGLRLFSRLAIPDRRPQFTAEPQQSLIRSTSSPGDMSS
jgi:DMSO/TMAO reductase YedYZ heme-binding membrane subunit